MATLLTLFDFGDGTTSTETRSQTNIAPQALFMLNSRFVSERSGSLARRLLETETADAARIRRAWRIVLGRDPKPEQIQDALKYILNFPANAPGDNARVIAWSSFCRALIASNDFMYVH